MTEGPHRPAGRAEVPDATCPLHGQGVDSAGGNPVRRPRVRGDTQDPTDAIDVDILCENAGPTTPGHRDDQAVQKAARRHPDTTALSVDARSRIEVSGRVERQEMAPQQQPTKIFRPSVITCAGKYLHEHGLGDGEGAAGGDQLGHPPIHRTARRPVELRPGGRVGEDHAAPRGA